MTGSPDLEQLRREVSLRLSAMQETMPLARLSEAQADVARAYGFASWGALKDAATRNAMAAMGSRIRLRRTQMRPRLDIAQEPLRLPEGAEPFAQGFFRAGMAAQLGFFGIIIAIVLMLLAWQYGGLGPALGVLGRMF